MPLALTGLAEIKKAMYAIYDTMRANWDIEESAIAEISSLLPELIAAT